MDSISESEIVVHKTGTSLSSTLSHTLIFECQKLRRNFQHAIENVRKSHTIRAIVICYVLCVVLVFPLWPIIAMANYRHCESWLFPSHRIDWHDWDVIEQDGRRSGIGEQGIAAYLPEYPESSKFMNVTYGYNSYLSEAIALGRSLPDLRPKQ